MANVALDETLVEQVRKAGGHRTQRAAVTAAMREYLQQLKRNDARSLFGKIEYFDDYDHKTLRRAKRGKR